MAGIPIYDDPRQLRGGRGGATVLTRRPRRRVIFLLVICLAIAMEVLHRAGAAWSGTLSRLLLALTLAILAWVVVLTALENFRHLRRN